MKLRLAVALIPGAIVLAAVSVLAHAPSSALTSITATHTPAPSPTATTFVSPWTTVQSASGSVTLTFRSDTGAFQLSIQGVGMWIGTATITHPGGHLVHLSGTVPAKFTAVGATRPSPTSIRFEGEVHIAPDNSSTQAAVEVWTGGFHYAIADHLAPAAAAPQAAKAILSAMAAHDWAGVYPNLAQPLRSNFTEAQFAALSSSQATPAMSAVTVTAPGAITMVAGQETWDGSATFTTTTSSGTTRRYAMTIRLLSEGGAWHLLGTGTPSPSA